MACEKDREKDREKGREKNRIERSNAVYQDRIVKELRLKGISDIARANELLTLGFDDDLNRRFAIEPGDATDQLNPEL